MTTLGPVEPAGPPIPRLGTPVMFPGSALEIPPPPRMKNGVLIGVPLTVGDEAGPGQNAEPEGETKAPGKGISNMYPPVVNAMTPRLAMTGERRSSRTQRPRSGRNLRRGFIASCPQSSGAPRLVNRGRAPEFVG